MCLICPNFKGQYNQLNKKIMPNNLEIPTGVIIEPMVEKDWRFGSAEFGTKILMPSGDWNKYLPTFEKQRRGFESMCCTNFSSTSAVETYFNYLIIEKVINENNLRWLKDNGYIDDNGKLNTSDRYDAIGSGTNPNTGNTLKAPADFKRKNGLIPEYMLPWTDDRTAYFKKDSITQKMYALGQEFLRRFNINFEIVTESDFWNALKYSPLSGACFAWNGVNNNIYYRVENQINHAICMIKPPEVWNILDSYDPFVKKLSNNYKFLNYAVRYIITENVVETPSPINKEDMLKTIKFNTRPEIYIVSPKNDKDLLWINDNDGTGFEDYKFLLNSGIIMPYVTISDALYASYNILGGVMKVDLEATPTPNNTIGLWQKILALFNINK